MIIFNYLLSLLLYLNIVKRGLCPVIVSYDEEVREIDSKLVADPGFFFEAIL